MSAAPQMGVGATAQPLQAKTLYSPTNGDHVSRYSSPASAQIFGGEE